MVASHHPLPKCAFEKSGLGCAKKAQLIVFRTRPDAIEDAVERQCRLEEQLVSMIPMWSMAGRRSSLSSHARRVVPGATTFAAETETCAALLLPVGLSITVECWLGRSRSSRR